MSMRKFLALMFAMLTVLAIACGGGAIQLLRLQREGKAPMPAKEFLRGNAIAAGRRLA